MTSGQIARTHIAWLQVCGCSRDRICDQARQAADEAGVQVIVGRSMQRAEDAFARAWLKTQAVSGS